MKQTRYRPMALLCLLAFLVACSDDGDDKTTPVPTASASATLTRVEIGSVVELNGSASRAPDGGRLTYDWSLTSKPTLSEASIVDASLANATFVADLPGSYEASLVVINDGKVLSQPSRITIEAFSSQPLAVARVQLFRLVNSLIELDASQSSAPDGADASGLEYLWTLSAPDGVTTPVLNNPTSAWASFSPAVAGMYIATLVVSHDGVASKPLRTYVIVTQGNAAPEALISAPTSIERSQLVELDASGSSDADGDSLQYRWRFAQRPVGSKAELANVTSIHASFTPDIVGQYRVELDVFDGTLTSSTTASINATLPTGAANQLPVIEYFDNGKGTNEIEFADFGQIAATAYDPDGGWPTYKWEALTDIPEGWTLQRAASLGGTVFTSFEALLASRSSWASNTANFQLVPPAGIDPSTPVELRARLTTYDAQDSTLVGDVKEWSLWIRNGANTRPEAIAHSPFRQVPVGATVQLDGSYSSDAEGNQITWQWHLLERPDNSTATLANPTAAATSFVADRAGNYRLALVVTDSHGVASNAPTGVLGATNLSSTVIVTAKPNTRNNPPSARWIFANAALQPPAAGTGTYGSPLLADENLANTYRYTLGDVSKTCPVLAGLTTIGTNCLDSFTVGFQTYDADADALIYDVVLEQPSGSSLQNSYTGDVNASGEDHVTLQGIEVPGNYRFILRALDGTDVSAPQTLTIQVADYPADYAALQLRMTRGCGNTETGQCLGNANGSDTNRLLYLPHNRTTCGVGICDKADYLDFRDHAGVMQYFVLQPVGGDFTLVDVQATTETYSRPYNAEQPEIRGLPEDNILRAGQTYVFSLWVPKLPDRIEQSIPVEYTWQFNITELGERGAFRARQTYTVPALTTP